MKKSLIVCLVVAVSLFSTTAFSETPQDTSIPRVDIRTNAVILQDGEYEVVVPLYNIISVYMHRTKKKYTVMYYGYYNESGREMEISKEDYEKLKRLIVKTEQ
jgi:hypothetical protein